MYGRGRRKVGGFGRPPVVAKIRRTYPDNWDELRRKVLERDGYRCRRCNANLRGVFYREVHHIIPLSRGGTNLMSNLISLCSDCHCKQH
jgi:5-methylcytosine-specific restriction endonuclease McrA